MSECENAHCVERIRDLESHIQFLEKVNCSLKKDQSEFESEIKGLEEDLAAKKSNEYVTEHVIDSLLSHIDRLRGRRLGLVFNTPEEDDIQAIIDLRVDLEGIVERLELSY